MVLGTAHWTQFHPWAWPKHRLSPAVGPGSRFLQRQSPEVAGSGPKNKAIFSHLVELLPTFPLFLTITSTTYAPMKYAVTCPGQGFIRSNLLAPYLKYRPLYQLALDEIDQALNTSFSEDMISNDETWLHSTSNAQPAILSMTVIIHRILAHHGIDLVANSLAIIGHSLGEYTALVLNNKLDLTTAVKLVRLRGQLMESLPLLGYKMYALMFKPQHFQHIYDVCQQHDVLANINGVQQIVISGHHAKLDLIITTLNKEKKIILRTTQLPVQIPFHNPILSPIEGQLTEFLSKSQQGEAITTMISNLTGDVVVNNDMVPTVISANSQPVQYVKSMDTLKNLGITTLFNLGPGTILHNLNRKYDFTNHLIDTVDEQVLESIRRLT